MDTPFTIVKKIGSEDRYTFKGIVIDDYLDLQGLRDIYFRLSGQEHKVGQKSCKSFPRKNDLILECHRLIKLYLTDIKEWNNVLFEQERKRVARERVAARKAKKLAIQTRVDAKAALLITLSDEDFEIEQRALTLALSLHPKRSFIEKLTLEKLSDKESDDDDPTSN